MPEDNEAGHDPVNHPSHYTDGKAIETILVIKNELSPEGYRGYLKGNVLKYVSREGHKGSLADQQADLQKAAWYLDRLAEESAK